MLPNSHSSLLSSHSSFLMQSAVSGDSGAAFCISYGISGLSFPVVSIFRSISGARGSCFAIFLHSHPSAPCFLPPYSDCNRISGVVYFWHTTDIQGSKDTDKQNPHTKWAKGSSIPPGNPLRQSSRTKKRTQSDPKNARLGISPKRERNPRRKSHKRQRLLPPLYDSAPPPPNPPIAKDLLRKRIAPIGQQPDLYPAITPRRRLDTEETASSPVEGWILKKQLPPRRRRMAPSSRSRTIFSCTGRNQIGEQSDLHKLYPNPPQYKSFAELFQKRPSPSFPRIPSPSPWIIISRRYI